jgi:FlaA1/EpsC-like NDP-sugar epimerase
VLGSHGSAIPLFIKQIERGGPVTVTHPEITRFFMTIPEACQLVLEAATFGNTGEIVLFDMGKSVKIVDLVKKMIKLYGLTLDKDIQIEFTGLRPGEKLYEELLLPAEIQKTTYNSRIMIAEVEASPFEFVGKEIQELIAAFDRQDNIDIVSRMKSLVPEYKSNNSIFEQLDEPTR